MNKMRRHKAIKKRKIKKFLNEWCYKFNSSEQSLKFVASDRWKMIDDYLLNEYFFK